jgi:hypothetical protein
MSYMYVILKPDTGYTAKDILCTVSYKLLVKRKLFFIIDDILDIFPIY